MSRHSTINSRGILSAGLQGRLKTGIGEAHVWGTLGALVVLALLLVCGEQVLQSEEEEDEGDDEESEDEGAEDEDPDANCGACSDEYYG